MPSTTRPTICASRRSYLIGEYLLISPPPVPIFYFEHSPKPCPWPTLFVPAMQCRTPCARRCTSTTGTSRPTEACGGSGEGLTSPRLTSTRSVSASLPRASFISCPRSAICRAVPSGVMPSVHCRRTLRVRVSTAVVFYHGRTYDSRFLFLVCACALIRSLVLMSWHVMS